MNKKLALTDTVNILEYIKRKAKHGYGAQCRKGGQGWVFALFCVIKVRKRSVRLYGARSYGKKQKICAVLCH
nr:MAG TPA: hypothetical protein [Podoviridae sp. ctaOY15]